MLKMDILRRFIRLPCDEQWLLCKATALLFSIRMLLWTLPFPTVRPFLVKACRHAQPQPRFPARKLAWAVSAAGQIVPGGTHCFSQAIALQVLLTRRGFESKICFGVQQRQSGAPLTAHAWVEHKEEILIGGENLDRFVRLTARSNSLSNTESVVDPIP